MSNQDRKAEKEAERLKIKAEILESAGPSMRDVELEDLNRKLSTENLKVTEYMYILVSVPLKERVTVYMQIYAIAADGNCLYRLELPPTSVCVSALFILIPLQGRGRPVASLFVRYSGASLCGGCLFHTPPTGCSTIHEEP